MADPDQLMEASMQGSYHEDVEVMETGTPEVHTSAAEAAVDPVRSTVLDVLVGMLSDWGLLPTEDSKKGVIDPALLRQAC